MSADAKFIRAIRLSTWRAFHNAYPFIDNTSTYTLISASYELVTRSRQLYFQREFDASNATNQFASQVIAELSLRGENTQDLQKRVITIRMLP